MAPNPGQFMLKEKKKPTKMVEEKSNLLAEKLRTSRRQANFTLTKISEITGINLRYLEALEDGRLKDLPPLPYIKGILKKYSRLFGLDENELFTLLENEWSRDKGISATKDVIPSLNQKRKVASFIKITHKISWPSLIIATLVSLTVLLFIGYQLRNFLAKPEINLLRPPENFITSTSSVELEGFIRYGRVLEINNRNVYFDENGHFKETINLTEGPNIIEIKATNLLGNKISTLERTVIYQK